MHTNLTVRRRKEPVRVEPAEGTARQLLQPIHVTLTGLPGPTRQAEMGRERRSLTPRTGASDLNAETDKSREGPRCRSFLEQPFTADPVNADIGREIESVNLHNTEELAEVLICRLAARDRTPTRLHDLDKGREPGPLPLTRRSVAAASSGTNTGWFRSRPHTTPSASNDRLPP